MAKIRLEITDETLTSDALRDKVFAMFDYVDGATEIKESASTEEYVVRIETLMVAEVIVSAYDEDHARELALKVPDSEREYRSMNDSETVKVELL